MGTARRNARRERKRKAKVKLYWWILALAACVCVAVFAGVQFYSETESYVSSEREYEKLRLAYAPGEVAYVETETEATDSPAGETPPSDDPAGQRVSEDDGAQPQEINPLLAINPDYIGWITIDGVSVEYPVVRGADNSKYLNTTFEGAKNKLGAIFLDARFPEGFSGRYAIIYGHNAKNGSMFGSLKGLLSAAEYPDIQILTAQGELLTYRIVSVRSSDVTDRAYRWVFSDEADFAAFRASLGAPEEAEHLLTLSTCTSGGNDKERLLVHAVLVE